MKKLLTVAGSDSSGGAGIQADLKTFAALGAYGMSCICTLTAQNTTGVSMVVNTPVEMVTAQLEAVYSDIPPDGVKTGMLSTPAIVSAVAEFLRGHKGPAIVVDPVMVATTGAILLEKEAIETYKDILIPEADLITPNIPESEVLSGLEIKTEKDMENAAERMMEYGCRAVLVKGGQASSRSEARRAVTQGGVSVEGEKITDIATAYVPADFEGEGKIVKKGKKNFRRVIMK